MPQKELALRLSVAAVGIPIVLLVIFSGGWVLGGMAALTAAVGVREFYALARRAGLEPFHLLGLITTVAVVLAAVLSPTPAGAAPAALGAILASTLGVFGLAVWLRGPEGRPLESTGVTLGGVLYLGVPLAFVPILRALPEAGVDQVAPTLTPSQASVYLLLPILVTWAGDTGAYLVGRAFGRTRLAPSASPGKTVEGAVAGLAASVAAAMAIWALGPFGPGGLPLTLSAAGAIGLVLGGLGQVGDLAESVLKRQAGAKDSGTLLPGHGGLLDRLDALLFAIPATWFLILIGGGIGATPP